MVAVVTVKSKRTCRLQKVSGPTVRRPVQTDCPETPQPPGQVGTETLWSVGHQVPLTADRRVQSR